MANLNIVLLEPQIPQNTGNIARTCAVTGAALHIIKPIGFTVTDSKLKRAGLDYWNQLDITYYDDIHDFYAKNSNATSYFLTTKAKKFHSAIDYVGEVFIFFGREDKGLPEDLLLANKDTSIRIPMKDNGRSLNLSNAVAIVTYELLRQWDYPQLKTNSTCIFD